MTDRPRIRTIAALALGVGLAGTNASGAVPARNLIDELSGLRERVLRLEGGVVDALRSQRQAQANVKRIQELLALQKKERELGHQRMAELERTVNELERRRIQLNARIATQRQQIRRFLIAMEHSERGQLGVEKAAGLLYEDEKLEAPRRRTLGNLASRGLKEIETLKADLEDADHIGSQIQGEKQQLAYLFQDLREKEGVLELNRQLQVDIIRKNHDERLAQLENYRALKRAESQVERLIGDFNARLELERATEAERVANRGLGEAGAFERLKGHLPLPLAEGHVVSRYGRVFDPRSNLYVFKKGIDIEAGKNAPVRAVSAGKVAYSGQLPGYGQVAIVDHGGHYYSLCANLGQLQRKTGETVAAGDSLGSTDDSGTPVYFEIRARNVPVNPLQWLSN